jgi:hypothetical protein
MKFILMIFLMSGSWGAYAVEALPQACKIITVTGSTVTAPALAPSSLVMINNVSEMDLWITHPISEPTAGAGWSSRLQSKHWSALALKGKAFELGCIESKPGHEQQVPCAGVLVVCQWSSGITFDDQHKQTGPYWAGENMLLPDLLAHLTQRGFKMPEASK